MKRLAGILLLIPLLLIGHPMVAEAQLTTGGEETAETEVTLPDPLTPEAVREMVSQMSDQEVRSLLLERLDAVAEEQAAAEAKTQGTGLVDFAQKATVGVFASIARAIAQTPDLWNAHVVSFDNFLERIGPNGLWILFVVMAGGIAAGLVAELVFNRLTRSWHNDTTAGAAPESLRDTVKFLFNRLCHDIFGVVVFFLVARWVGWQIALNGFEDQEQIKAITPYAGLFWLNLIVLPRFAAAISRFILAPRRPEFRLVHADDETAQYLHRNMIGVVLLVGFTIAVLRFNALNGIAMGELRLGFWLNVAIHLYIALVAWRAREGLAAMMRGPDPDVTEIEERIARAYPWFIIGVSVGTWYLVEIIVVYGQFERLAGAPHVWMMMLLISAPALDTLVRGLVRHLVPPMRGEGPLAEAAYRSTQRSYIRIGRVIVFALVILLIGKIWGLDFQNLAAAGVGAAFAGRLIEIIVILATGYVLMEVVSLYINRMLAAEQTGVDQTGEEEPGGGEGGGPGSSRLSTVLPLVLGMAKVAIIVIFVLIALGNIGIDITPLLAGAGIVGLAIGFGAQKLVTDVVSGIFFLVDDAFRVGEFVDVEGTVGSVEKISIRSMQLRHHQGPVHTIPYGEIPKLTNYSRDWVIMKLKFTVPFDTDPNKVKKIFKKIGAEMMEVPEYAEDFLQPFKSQGVFDIDDVGMVIRGKFMAKPGRQFVLRKEIYNRVKKAFEENGITFARREVRVALPTTDPETPLTAEQKSAIAGAAAGAAQSAEQGKV